MRLSPSNSGPPSLPACASRLFQIPGFCVGGTSIPGVQNKVNCDVIVGYKSVYRMCFAMACFFFLFSVIMIRVRSSKDPRAAVQNGFASATEACCPLLGQHRHRPSHSLSFVSGSGSSSSWCWWASRWGRSSSRMATLTQVRRSEPALGLHLSAAQSRVDLSAPSLVLLWRGGLLHLHHHPAHPAGGLRPLLEPGLAAERRGRKQEVLVWR